MSEAAVHNRPGSRSFSGLEARVRALELSVARLKTCDPAQVLSMRSEIENDLSVLDALGRDVRAERSRLDTVDNALRSHAALLARCANRVGGLAALRERTEPPDGHWWWWLDAQAAEARRRDAKKLVATVFVAAVVVLVVSYVLSRTGGTPEEKQAAVYASRADQRMMQGDYAGAIDAYGLSLASVEAQPDLWVALAVLYEAEGDPSRAGQALARASELVHDRATLEAVLARNYERINDLESALEHAELAVSSGPDSADAYLARGSVLEGLLRWDDALADFERSSDLALAQGNDSLYVVARARMGMLLQMRGAGLPGAVLPQGAAP